MEYEYGIAHYKHDPNGPEEDEQGPHRTGMTLYTATEWLDEWKKDGGRPDAFYIIRRPKGAWEAFDGDMGDLVPSRPARRVGPRIRGRKEIEREKSIQEGLTNS